MKVLNLYAGIGGNRTLWKDVEVTAIEYSQEIADIYADRFPEDKVIVTDAHEYLLKNYMNFDFIWASPPCTTHSRYNTALPVKFDRYPDMKLYQEILFLNHYFKGFWMVENVKPYYKPLIVPSTIIGRHLIWSNFQIFSIKEKNPEIKWMQIHDLLEYHNLDKSIFDNYKLKHINKRTLLRNCVNYKIGHHILMSLKTEMEPELWKR